MLSFIRHFSPRRRLIRRLAAFHVHDQPHHLRQDPPGDWFAPPTEVAMSQTLFALPPGYPQSGGKGREIHRRYEINLA